MKKLIVNADDFGFTSGVNRGIVRAFQNGIVTSCTIMASGDAFDHAVELARQEPRLPVGCHLTLVNARPVAPAGQIGSLLNGSSSLPGTLAEVLLRLVSGTAKQEHIEREFRAQIETVMSAGINPTHLDTHKHLHAHPRIFEALVTVAREFGISRVRNPFEQVRRNSPRGIRARQQGREFKKQQAAALAMRMVRRAFRGRLQAEELRAPDCCYGISLTGMLDSSAIQEVVRQLESGVTELICHPGLYDEHLERAVTRLKREREVEVEALTDPQVRTTINDNQVELISYRDI
ncbi:MAG TPA: ChbG/HpnK family deacetylase [Acidobacteriota bacterium]|jgi:hopanoid biosynthesis associated protein HpnK